MKERPIVIYHANCKDGLTAMWVAHHFFEGDIEDYAAVNGVNEYPDVTGRDVYIVDFSYSREVLLEMNEKAKSLVVLDHHKTAQGALEGLPFCQFDMNRSGAGMTWDFFYPNQERPWLVNYVEDQDIWKWEHPDARDVCSFINSVDNEFENWMDFCYNCFDNPDKMLALAKEHGAIINKTIGHFCKVTQDLGTLGVIDGHEVPVVNAPFFAASQLLNEMCSKPLADGSWPKFAVGWHVNKFGQVKYSLRSTENPETGEAFDVSALAQKFGGGGHHKASAFRTKGLHKLVHESLKPLRYKE